MPPILGPRRRTCRAKLTPLAFALLGISSQLYAQEATLPEVVVSSQEEGKSAIPSYRSPTMSAGALGTKDALDTPFSTSVATQEFIANQQATTLADAFKADAAVIAQTNSINSENSQIAIRGLPLDTLTGIKIDGLNTVVWQADLPLEHFEQVSLLKGLAGFMYGFGSPGGIANYQVKRAGDTPITTVKTGISTESQYVVSTDVSRRFGEDDRMGLRVNAVSEGGDTYLNAPIRRESLSAAFDVRLTPNLQWTVDALYQKRKVNGSLFALALGTGVDVPAPVDGSTLLGQAYGYHQTTLGSIGTQLHWNFATDWDLSVGYRGMRETRTNYDTYLTVIDNSGNYTSDLYRWYSKQNSDAANLIVTGRLQTGSIGHEVTFGTDVQNAERINGVNFGDDSLGNSNLYHTVVLSNPGNAVDETVGKASGTRDVGLFASDTIQWSQQWSSIIGLRYSDYTQSVYNYDTDGARSAQYAKTALSPTLAMIWKPVPTVSYYASYVESLEQGGTAPTSAVNANEVLGPLKSKQYELGVKKQGSGWSTEAALFRIERGLEYTNSSNMFVQEGGLIFQGLDVAGRVELGSDWAVMASSVLMNSRNKSDDATVNGNRAANVADVSSSVQAEYQVPNVAGLVLSGGVRYVGSRALEAANTHILGAYRVYDAGLRYKTKMDGKNLTFRANLNNLTDEKYWLGSWNYALTQGAPRTLQASAEIEF